MKDQSGVRVLYFSTAIAVGMTSILLGVIHADSEWIAGGGALLSSFALAYVFIQIRFERDLSKAEVEVAEKLKIIIDRRTVSLESARQTTNDVMQTLKEEVYYKRRINIMDGLAIALPGEILNGFAGIIQRTIGSTLN